MDDPIEALRGAARAALPPVEGEVRLPGLGAAVEIRRDRWGVPHIYADHLTDLWTAQSYVMASERLFQIELAYRLGLGRLSELFGELTLSMDRFVRTLGWNRAAAEHAAAWDDLSLEMAAAGAAGARAWLEAMPAKPVEYVVLGVDPWLPDQDEAALAGAGAAVYVAWSLSRAWDNDLLRAEIAERFGVEAMRALFPDALPEPEAVRAAKEATDPRLAMLRNAILAPSGEGSNAWVVASSRSATGAPLLANDPHLVVQAPSAWFEAHLVGPGVDVAGVTFPFTTGIVIGHNDRIAWGFTNSEGDVQDLYLERLSEDGASAKHLDDWEPVTVVREEIGVRGRAEPEVLEVRETRHGPLVGSYMVGIASPRVIQGGIRRPYALRWVGAEGAIEPSTIHRLDTARSWEEFRAAVARWHCPGQNMVYADVEGNIGYQLTGRYPARRAGDGSLPVPGWTDEHEWDGWIPFDELPRAFNPEAGFVVTANNPPGGDGQSSLGVDFLPPYRARRIAQLLTARPRHDRESFAAIQADTRSLLAPEILRHLLAIEARDERQTEALGLMIEWDQDLGRDSAAAAIYESWCTHLAARILRPRLGRELFEHYFARRQWTNGFHYRALPELLAYPTARWFGEDGAAARDDVVRAALDEALTELTDRLGEPMTDWRWGAVHRARFAGRLAAAPGLGELFTVGEVELGGDEQTVAQAHFEPGAPYEAVVVPSWRQIVDLWDLDASVGVLTLGQSGNPESPHYRDQLPLWASGEHHPMPFTRDAVERATASVLRLVP
ncbi:MAG TPA: penicillin acylase family protein [Actinomycetota bacterium]